MADPLTVLSAISLGSQAISGIGRLFGRGKQDIDIPPEFQEAMALMQQRAREGFGDETLTGLREGLSRRVGSEFGGIGAQAVSSAARAGAGLGVQQAILSDLGSKRLQAIGQGISNIQIANEQEKARASSELARMSEFLTRQLNPAQTGRSQGLTNLSPLLNLVGAFNRRGGFDDMVEEELFNRPFRDDFLSTNTGSLTA